MSYTYLPLSTDMEARRVLGLLVCQCAKPRPVLLLLWQAIECARCGKKVIDHDVPTAVVDAPGEAATPNHLRRWQVPDVHPKGNARKRA